MIPISECSDSSKDVNIDIPNIVNNTIRRDKLRNYFEDRLNKKSDLVEDSLLVEEKENTKDNKDIESIPEKEMKINQIDSERNNVRNTSGIIGEDSLLSEKIDEPLRITVISNDKPTTTPSSLKKSPVHISDSINSSMDMGNKVAELVDNPTSSRDIMVDVHISPHVSPQISRESNAGSPNSISSVDDASSPQQLYTRGHMNNVVNHNNQEEEKVITTATHKKLMWAGQSNIVVAVRVRPLNKKEQRHTTNLLKILDEKVVVVLDPTKTARKKDILRKHRSREKRYAFDFAFGPSVSTLEVYNSTTRFLVDGVINGFNATVFAYGATGAGKTHTMLGNLSEPGCMALTLQDLFKEVKRHSISERSKFKVTLSYLEVYNELIRDLLSPSSEYLDLREDPLKGPVVAGITELQANSTEDVLTLLHKGNKNRTQESTAANAVSSRSHAVLQITVEKREAAPGTTEKVKIGKLSMVDLAGSERASTTKNRGQRLIEGANINRSLLALGNCINALGEKGAGRDSKLTRLLKDSLGGNCRTVMIANASPAAYSFEETLNTLKYANRAKNIKTKVKRNVLNVNYHISEYVNLIAKLRDEISALKDNMKVRENHNFGSPLTPLQDDRDRGNSKSPSKSPIAGSKRLDSKPERDEREGVERYHISTAHGVDNDAFNDPISKSKIRGRARSRGSVEKTVMNALRNEIVLSFKERMQLRRSLIEVDAQNVQNAIEIGQHEMEISHLLSVDDDELNRDNGTGARNVDIQLLNDEKKKRLKKNIKELQINVQRNKDLRVSLENRLADNEKHSKQLREKQSDKVTTEERKELMELEYRVGVLELENMELEHSRMLHDQLQSEKDVMIHALKMQLEARDQVIASQRQVLVEHSLDDSVSYAPLNALPPVQSIAPSSAGVALGQLGKINPDRRDNNHIHLPTITSKAIQVKPIGPGFSKIIRNNNNNSKDRDSARRKTVNGYHESVRMSDDITNKEGISMEDVSISNRSVSRPMNRVTFNRNSSPITPRVRERGRSHQRQHLRAKSVSRTDSKSNHNKNNNGSNHGRHALKRVHKKNRHKSYSRRSGLKRLSKQGRLRQHVESKADLKIFPEEFNGIGGESIPLILSPKMSNTVKRRLPGVFHSISGK